MNYGSILQTAWRATWKHKVMWLLGMAVMGTTGSFGFSFGNSFISTDTTSSDYRTQVLYDAIAEILLDYWLLFALLGICLLLLALVAYVFHFIAIGGMYQGAAWARQGQPVRFWAMCRVGIRYCLPLLGLTILFGLAISLPVALIIGLIVLLFLSIIGIVLAVPLLLLLLIAMIPLSAVSMALYSFTVQEIVLQDTNISRSIRLAWRSFKANWLNTLLAYATIIGWNLGSTLILISVTGVIGLPLVFFGYLAYTSEAWLVLLLLIVVAISCVAVIALLMKGISQSFSAHLWHGVYQACRTEPAALAQR